MDRRIILSGSVLALMLAFVIAAAAIRAHRAPERHVGKSPDAKGEGTEANQGPVRHYPSSPDRAAAGSTHTSSGKFSTGPSSSPSTSNPRQSPSKTNVPPDAQAAALGEATLLGFIQNAQVAEQKGDKVTRDAMLRSLKKDPERARELVRKELARTTKPAVSIALGRILEMLQ